MDTPKSPSEKQRIALQYLYDNKTNFVGYGGAGYGGKTYLLCRWITNMCLQYAGVGYGIGRRTLTDLKKTTVKTLFEVFSECNIKEGRDYNYNQQLNVITFSNKSEIFLFDTAYQPSDPLYTRLGGYELTGCAIDESVESPIEAINILFIRTGRRKNREYGIGRKFLETFNPAKNHVYRRYYKPYKDGTLKPTYAFIPALPKDNPSLDTKEYVKGILENSTQVDIERFIYGNFEYDDDPAKLINYDAINDLFTNDFVKEGEKCISADIARFGSNKFVVMAWSGYRVMVIESHDRTSITDCADIIKRLADKHKIPRSKIIVDEDGLGSGVVDILKCKGFVANTAPVVVKGKKENYNNLKSQCYFKLAEKINEHEVYINCDNVTIKDKLIEELEVVKQKGQDKDNKMAIIPKDEVKILIGRSPDYSDCLMMRIALNLQKSGIMASV